MVEKDNDNKPDTKSESNTRDNQDKQKNKEGAQNYYEKFEHGNYRIFRSELEDIRKKRKTLVRLRADRKSESSSLEPENNEQSSDSEENDHQNNLDADRPSTKHNLLGLCLSGGGIRSATFNLGFLQALFHQGVLNRVDYLSTVSGGGYIGSCLTALFNSYFTNTQSKNEGVDLWSDDHFPFELNSTQNRQNNSDRNSSAIAKKERGKFVDDIEKSPVRHLRYFSNYITAGENFIDTYLRPSVVYLRGFCFHFFMFVPYLLLAALVLTLLFNINGKTSRGTGNSWFFHIKKFEMVLENRIRAKNELEQFIQENFTLMPLGGEKKSEFDTLQDNMDKAEKAVRGEWIIILKIPGVLFFCLLAFSLFFLPVFTKNFTARKTYGKIFGWMLFIILLIVGIQLYGCAIVYWKILRIHNGILVLPALSFLAPWLLRNLDLVNNQKKKPWGKIIISLILMSLVPLLLLYLIGFIINFLSFWRSYDFITISGGALIISSLLIYLIDQLIDINKISLHNFYRDRLSRAYLIQHYHDYKDENGISQPLQPFEKVKHNDAILLSSLYPKIDILGPYHILNTNLNLSKVLPKEIRKGILKNSDKNKEGIFRNSESFILSKYWCGSEKTGYIRTEDYEKSDPHLDLGTAMAVSAAALNIGMGHCNMPMLRSLMGFLNIRLGYWAPNPKQCSTRKRNPFGKKHLSSCRVICECLGISKYSPHSPFINLSDGGHFDNIGVYELLRRRCKYIIVSDAEADPDMKFQALSYILRLARIDFGIDITINLSGIKPDQNGISQSHCVVGKIFYPAWKTLPEEYGYLLYCKSSLTGNETQHLYEYKVKHPNFPHQTTSDQWFDEQQFEAYRELGYQVGKTTFAPLPKINQDTPTEEIFLKLKEHWHPRSEAIEKYFTVHTQELNRIITLIKKDIDLKFMDVQMFPEWEELIRGAKPDIEANFWYPQDAGLIRKGFYVCNLMIQLMENVYVDLDLEKEWSHPDNRGWMNLFMHWSWTGIFCLTWSICACTYGSRFQNFCEKRLCLTIGKVHVKEIPEELYQKKDFDENLAVYLSPLEIKKLKSVIPFDKSGIKLYVFQLKVQNPVKENQHKTFGFGFAVTDKNYKIIYLRIQDHLRRMGLARKGLKALIIKWVDKADKEERLKNITLENWLPKDPDFESEHPDFDFEQFQRIFDSVKTEVASAEDIQKLKNTL